MRLRVQSDAIFYFDSGLRVYYPVGHIRLGSSHIFTRTLFMLHKNKAVTLTLGGSTCREYQEFAAEF